MDLLSLVFPRRCVGCGELGTYLCADCVNRLIPLAELYCPICRKPSKHGYVHRFCWKRDSIDGLISCYPYVGLMKKSVSKFKYSFVSDLTQTLIELMITGSNHPQLFSPWTLVPVPLHRSRLKWRGFNQAEVLAKGLAQAWDWPLKATLLTRERMTEPQMTLSGIKRRRNLAGAFKVTEQTTMPERIMLVDDVATTCSTLNECAKVLKHAGVREVWGLTLAQKIPH